MHFKVFIGHQSLLDRKMQTLHRAMLPASSHGGALGAFLRTVVPDGIAARLIVRPGAILQAAGTLLALSAKVERRGALIDDSLRLAVGGFVPKPGLLGGNHAGFLAGSFRKFFRTLF